jgi:hypothetical protein
MLRQRSLATLICLLSLPLLHCSSDADEESTRADTQTERPEVDAIGAPDTDLNSDTEEAPDVALPEADGDTVEADATEGSDAVLPPAPTFDETIVAPGAGALPAQFAVVTEATNGPEILYPTDATAIPRNLDPMTFQWEGSSGQGFRLRLWNDTTGVEVFTTDWNWTGSETEWTSIVDRFAGSTVQIQVSELRSGSAAIGDTTSLQITTDYIDGAVYYWAPSQSAIVRLPINATEPEPFVTGTVFNCAGCHALSPDGSRIAYTRSSGGTPIGNLGVIATDDARTQIQPEVISGYYPSFGPDNVHMAVARGSGITIVNTDTGEDAGVLPRPDGFAATQPAWSPVNDTIVFASGPGGGAGDALGALGTSGSGLAVVTRQNTSTPWRDSRWLLESGALRRPGETLFYPSISPDGNWVAFNRADSAAGAGSSPPSSELWLSSSNPDAPWGGIFLERAQGPDGTTNSWPKWAPAGSSSRLWVAFTSDRAYGRLGEGNSQIWIAAVDPNQALLGDDPSASAYWMPAQELGASNHVAYWAPYRKGDEE